MYTSDDQKILPMEIIGEPSCYQIAVAVYGENRDNERVFLGSVIAEVEKKKFNREATHLKVKVRKCDSLPGKESHPPFPSSPPE